MKRLVFLLVFAGAALFAKAQDPITETEYNYITKGIKVIEESGMELKKTYAVKYLTIVSTVEKEVKRTVKIRSVTRETDVKPFAFLCIYINEATGFKDYLCIPGTLNDTVNWDKFYQAINEYDEMGKSALLYGVAHLAVYYNCN